MIVDLVLSDLKDRAEAGLAKYGTYLRAHNGRDALVDAYQEAMDLVMYLRQAIEERINRCVACRKPDFMNWHDGGLHCPQGVEAYTRHAVCPTCGGFNGHERGCGA